MQIRLALFLSFSIIFCRSVESETQYASIPKQYNEVNKLIDKGSYRDALIKLNDVLHQSIREERFAYTFIALQDMVFISEKNGNFIDQMKYLLFGHILYCGINDEFKHYPDMINLRKLIQDIYFDRFEAIRSSNDILPNQFEFITFSTKEVDVPLLIDLYLDRNEASLNPKTIANLSKLSNLLSSFDTTLIKFFIEGNNAGDENEDVANRRSINVSNFFKERNGTVTLITINNGSKKPHAKEDSKAGREYNQTVDVRIQVEDIKKFIEYLETVSIITD